MVHLHVHSMFSLLDANIKIDELLDKVKELGQTAIALTDHGYMYGCVEFYKKAQEKGIKPIIGCELYICDNVEEKNKESVTYHLLLLAKNEAGRLNLQRLAKLSTTHKYRGKPRIDWNLLTQYHEGLICLSACMAGEVSRALMNNKPLQAKQVAMRYKELFGDDYYIEYQSHANEEQLNLNMKLVELADALDIKYVVTCDSHYLTQEDQKYHSIFVQIGQSREAGETYNDCYIQSEEDVLLKCTTTNKNNKIAIQNTHEIADKCNAKYPLSAPIIPHTDIPNGFKNEESYFKYLCNKGFTEKKLNTKPISEQLKYKQRAKYEMNAVLKMGFEGYYLLVYSYVSSVKRRGIGRGSSGGSLLAYLMGITDIDPLQYGLYFERFIDVGALDLLESGKMTRMQLKIPDVDTDFSPKDRDTVKQYIIDKYKEENVVGLGQFYYIWAKGAIKDIGKVLDIPFSVTNEMTKQLDGETIEEALDSGVLDAYKDEYPELFDYASRLSGLPKSFGVHPSGTVICMRNADYYNALSFDEEKNIWVLQGDMVTGDDLGLVKIDLLGLRTLDVIYDVLDMIGKDYEYIAPHNINLKDELVWNEFKQGNAALIFQFESLGMRKTLKDMGCDNIDDLGVANALYRPGAMNYIQDYINRKKGLEKTVYLHKDLEKILSVTFGVIVYQEQLIEIGKLANLKNPDELRQATAKKKPKLMAKIEPELKIGLMTRGWTQEQVDKLWEDILLFAKYSFNKSHSAAYALTAYISMFMKTHYPVEYICAYVNSYDGDVKQIAKVLQEAIRMNVEICFDVWKSILPYTSVKDNKVLLGINTLKSFGSGVSTALKNVGAREHNTFLDLLIDFSNESDINKSQLMTLIQMNMFKEYGNNGKLEKIYQLYLDIYGRKQFNKDNLPIEESILKKYSKETEKQYRDIDSVGLFNELCISLEDKKIPIKRKLNIMFENQGIINYINPQMINFGYIIQTDTKYSPKVRVYYLNNGECETCKVSKKTYFDKPIEVGDIVQILKTSKKHRRMWNEDNQKWIVMDDVFDTWVDNYIIR